MDVLNRRRRHRLSWLAVTLAIWVGAAACLSLRSTHRTEPSFPHRVHTVDNGLACTFCHGSVYSSERPGMPPPELCAPCHDQIDAQKPADRRVGAFFGPDGRYLTVADASMPSDVRFSHRAHTTESKLACTACHGNVDAQDAVPMERLVQKSECMQCHAAYGLQNTCGECHSSIDETWQPPSHADNWLRGHGPLVRFGSELSADRCDLCHREQSGCKSCHEQMAPRSHDQTFRTRTHGLQAAIDRSRCATCHTQDSCAQCHQQTRPRSHRGGYGAPQDRHCVSCHLPAATSGCATCHLGTPSHDLATPLPPGHIPAMNCRLCHGNGQPLPHPDGGHVCTACHK